MNKSAIFSKAHNLVKKVIKAGDNYAVTFGACLKVIYEGLKKMTNKAGVSISTYKEVFLVKVTFSLKDDFKKNVKAQWQPETKEWLVRADQENALRNWARA